MSTAKQDLRLSGTPYRKEIANVTLQFELIRFLLKQLTETDKKKFFRQFAEKGIEGAEKLRALCNEGGNLSADIAEQCVAAIIGHTKREQRQRNKVKVYHYVEFLEDRLNQSELLFLVAHFESFMKLVHERFLRAAPHKVFGTAFRGKQRTRVELREIFSAKTQAWSTSKFLKELITKEVKWLDAQGTQQKAAYFEKHFGISFGSVEDGKALKNIMRLRNQISHEIFEVQKSEDEMLKERLGEGKELPLVPDGTLRKARELFDAIPRKCLEIGAKTYHSNFRQD